MIQRFNFYDIYGYLVPGVVLLGIFWLPFGLLLGRWPCADWSSALVGLVFAYVAGHILHSIAEPGLPHSDPIPHNVLLDSKDKTLSRALRERLYALIQNQFRIDVREMPRADGELKRRRQDAFFLCREFLARRGAASYAEQFQGMYALMRGVTAALILGAAFYVGWGSGDLLLSPWLAFEVRSLGIFPLLLAVWALGYLPEGAETQNEPPEPHWVPSWVPRDRRWLRGMIIASLIMGVFVSWSHPQGFATGGFMLGLGVSALGAAYWCYRRYENFSTYFAASIYRGFASLY
jgi:hypothetical protein